MKLVVNVGRGDRLPTADDHFAQRRRDVAGRRTGAKHPWFLLGLRRVRRHDPKRGEDDQRSQKTSKNHGGVPGRVSRRHDQNRRTEKASAVGRLNSVPAGTRRLPATHAEILTSSLSMFAVRDCQRRFVKSLFFLLTLSPAFVTVRGQDVAENPVDAQRPLAWQDPSVVEINCQPARATSWPYPNRRLAIADDRGASPNHRSLNGTWKFAWSPEPDARPREFFRNDFDVTAWDDIAVPGNWQRQGYGTPVYSNIPYPFRVDPPRVMGQPPENFTNFRARDPVGSYRRDFEVPSTWGGQKIYLQFAGVDSAFFVWVNGRQVGYSQDSRTSANFDVTDFVRDGTNTLAVEVYRYSDGSYLEDQDFWRMSGIFRDVDLWSVDPLHVRDFFVTT